jgi:hemerythrin
MEFVWKEEYEIGIKDIDAQHREIFSLMVELNDAIHLQKPKEVLDGILESILETSQKHFAFEERLLKKNKYENLPSHQTLHTAFGNRVERLIDTFEEGTNLSDHLADFLEEWLVHHIEGEDRKFVEFLHNKGIY